MFKHGQTTVAHYRFLMKIQQDDVDKVLSSMISEKKILPIGLMNKSDLNDWVTLNVGGQTFLTCK